MDERKKKIKLKVKESKKTGIENYISISIKLIGLLFIGFSLYYFIGSQGYDFLNIIYSYFTSSNDSKIIYNASGEFPIETIICLLIGYIPAICGVLVIQFYVHNNINSYNKYLVPIIISTAIYNTINCFYWVFYCGIFYYNNYFIATILLIITLILFFTSYLNSRKKSLLISILFYFYAFILGILLQSYNENRYLYIFIPITIFSIPLYYFNKEIKNGLASLLNIVFAYLFLILFIIKRIVFNFNPSNLALFISFSIVFYVVFYWATFMLYLYEKKKIFASINILNTVVFLGLNAIVISKLNDLNYLFIPILVSIATQIISIFLSSKFINEKIDFRRFEITLALLISSFISLLFFDYFISVFLGISSLLLFLFARNNKIKSPMPFVVGFLLIMGINIIYIISNAYINLIKSSSFEFNSLIQNAFINLGIGLFCVSIIRKSIQNSKETEEGKIWFNRRKYLQYFDIILAILILLFFEWTVFYLFVSKTYIAVFSKRVLLLLLAIFLYFLIKLEKTLSIKLKRWSYFSICLYSVYFICNVYFQNTYENCSTIISNTILLPELILHYVELSVAVFLFYVSFSKLESLSGKSYQKIMKYILILVFVLITVICCFEYDYISTWKGILSISKFDNEKYEIIIDSNKLLPYSLIILLFTSFLLILGLKMKRKTIKIVSLLVFVLIIAKIFLYDFTMISDSAKSFAFVVIGIILLLLSWVYNANNEKKKRRLSNNS